MFASNLPLFDGPNTIYARPWDIIHLVACKYSIHSNFLWFLRPLRSSVKWTWNHLRLLNQPCNSYHGQGPSTLLSVNAMSGDSFGHNQSRSYTFFFHFPQVQQLVTHCGFSGSLYLFSLRVHSIDSCTMVGNFPKVLNFLQPQMLSQAHPRSTAPAPIDRSIHPSIHPF